MSLCRECQRVLRLSWIGFCAYLSVVEAYDIRCEYDTSSNLVALRSSNAPNIVLTYDALHRPIEIRPSDGRVENITWDGSVSEAGIPVDRKDRVSFIDQAGLLHADMEKVTCRRDRLGRVTIMGYPEGFDVCYSYNAADCLVEVCSTSGHGASYGWNPQTGLLQEVRYSNGWSTSYAFDCNGLLLSVCHCDQLEQRQFHTTYEYDDCYRCIGKSVTTLSRTWRERYTYDVKGQLVQVSYSDGYFERYTYDALGNRLTKETPLECVNYTFDLENQLVCTGENCYEWDSRGNPITVANGASCQRLSFDGCNQLRSVEKPGLQISYRYDLDGHRIGKTVDGIDTAELVHSTAAYPTRVAMRKGTSGWQRCVLGLEPICEVGPGGVFFFLYDRPQGSVIGVVDQDGQLVGECSYTPFGELRNQDGVRPSIGWMGSRVDSESDWILFGWRWYDPATGRFLSRDPLRGKLADPLSWNPYLYAHNDPINSFDPFGLDTLNIYVVPRFRPKLVNPERSSEEDPKERIWHFCGHAFIGIECEGEPEVLTGNQKKNVNGEKGPGGHDGYLKLAYAESFSFEVEDGLGQQILSQLKSDVKHYQWRTENCADYAARALDMAEIEHPNFKLMGIVTDPMKIYQWGQQLNQQQLITNHQDRGGVLLNAIANIDAALDSLQGVTWDSVTNQLILIGERNVNFPKMDIDDFTVAMQSVFGLKEKSPQDPGVSIGTEPSELPGYAKVRYDGTTENTHFGKIMFDADFTLKKLMFGQDSYTGRPFTCGVTGYRNMLQILNNLWVLTSNEIPSDWSFSERVWIEPEKITLELSENKQSLQFTDTRMRAVAELREGGNVIMHEATKVFANHLTEHYDEFAVELPIFGELKRLGQITAIAKWIQANRIPFEVGLFANRTVPYVETPTHAPVIDAPYAGGFVTQNRLGELLGSGQLPNEWQIKSFSSVFRGGINLRFNERNLIAHIGQQADKLGAKVKASRPNEDTLAWEVDGLQALVAPLARSPKDGCVKYSAVDLVYPVRGKLELALRRRYSSFDDQIGEFGMGWTVAPAGLRFPVYKVNVFMARKGDGADVRVVDSCQGYNKVYVRDAGGEEEFTLVTAQQSPLVLLYMNATRHKVLICDATGKYGLQSNAGVSIFDQKGRLERQQDRTGIGINYRYENSKLTNVTHDCGAEIRLEYVNGKPVKAIGPSGREICYVVDECGKLTSVINAAGQKTSYAYDSFGRLTGAQDPNENWLFETSYDLYNRAIDWYCRGVGSCCANYNLYERYSRLCRPSGLELERQYDNQHRLLTEYRNGVQVASCEYEGGSQPIKEIDASGNETRFVYSANGCVTSVRDAIDRPVDLEWSSCGDLLAIEDCYGLRTEYQRDTTGRVVSVTMQDKNGEGWVAHQFTYDPQTGDLLSHTDAEGRTTAYVYDDSGRLIHERSPGGFSTAYSYNPYGRLANCTMGLGFEVSFEYDLVDRLLAVTEQGIRTEYDYDPAGNLVAKRGIEGIYCFEYDVHNRLTKVIDSAGHETVYHYNQVGQLHRVQLPNGTGLLREYDEFERLIYETSRPEELARAA